MEYQPVYTELRKYNIIMGVLHLIQAMVVFLISSDFSLPVTTSFLHYDSLIRVPKGRSVA